jgi:hypothetical protein
MEAGRRRRSRRLQLPRGRGEHLDRRLVARAGGVLDVMGALDRARAGALQRGRGAGVGAQPPAARRRCIDGVADDRVPEGEAARRRRLPHQRTAQQLVERRQGRRLGQLRDRRGEAGLEGVAGGRGRVEQPARVGGQRAQLGGQRGRDRGRDRAVARGARAGDRPDAGELLKVERVAAGLGVDGRGGIADELGGLGRAQRRERDRRRAVLARRHGQRGGQHGRDLPGARRQRQQGRSGERPAHQRGERVERRRVGPVDVVEAEHERGQALERVAQRRVHRMPIPVDGVPADRVPPQRVREVGLVLRRPPPAHRDAARLRALRQMGQQGRLADSRLALEHDDARSPDRQRVQRAGERLAL